MPVMAVDNENQHEQAGDYRSRPALELAGRIGLADHVSFALVRLGSNALARGDTGQAEELCRRALAMAEAASTPRFAAHARVRLARVLEAAGDADTAEKLYRSVVDWSQTPRPRQVRELLFVVLAGSPGAAALRGLARLAAARGTTTRPTTCRPAPPRWQRATAPRPTRCEGRLWRPDRCAGAGSAGGVGGCAGRVPGEASRQVVRRGQRLPRLGAVPWPEGPRRTPTERRIFAEGGHGPATRRMLGVPWQCQPRPRQPHGSRVRQRD